MRSRLGMLLVTAIVAVLGVGTSEGTCRVGGEYRVTGPNVTGSLQFTETASDQTVSSGTARLLLIPKQACPTCLVLIRDLVGEYQAGPGNFGLEDCGVFVSVRSPRGGSVILFALYDAFYLDRTVDINVTLGIRGDSFLKP